jgi:predicted 3-demethylubiquinone-9 3-methyltransferase (glyoxalase superfamily)
MTPKNTICLWYEKDAEEAARFYASVFPGCEVTAVRRAPATIRTARKATS